MGGGSEWIWGSGTSLREDTFLQQDAAGRGVGEGNLGVRGGTGVTLP